MKNKLPITNYQLPISKKGFTLIELLVVISILGLLAGLILSNVSGIRERARDVARKSDLDQIKKALRIYYNDFNEYPAGIPEAGLEFSNGSMVYLKRVPGDPRSKDPYGYYRASCADGTDDFRLLATLENESDPSIEESKEKCPRDCGAPAYGAEPNKKPYYVVCAD